MQISVNSAKRLLKKEKCNLVFNRLDHKPAIEDLHLSAVSKKQYAKCLDDFLKYDKTACIWEGQSMLIIAYYK